MFYILVEAKGSINRYWILRKTKKIKLLTLINRRFTRHLPIQPNYIGVNVDTLQNDRVNVSLGHSNGDAVYILNDENETNFC